VIVEYNLELSTSVRAVWTGRGLMAGTALHLAVVRSSCGGLCADLTLQRLVPQGVAAPIVWQSVAFDLLQGGAFRSAQGDARGSVLIVTPNAGAAYRNVDQGAGKRPQPAQPSRRKKRG
jgi:hypothetical protein